MAILVRALGIGLAATAAYLVMTAFDDGEGGANIGAGLAVFAVLAVAGLVWALVDGWDRRGVGTARRLGLGPLLLRWVVVSVLAVVVVIAAMVLRNGSGYLSDLDASSMVFLVLLVLVPSVIGALIGYAVRGSDPSAPEGRRRGVVD